MTNKRVRVTSWDWKPVRDGAKYCSPSCGGGCTYHSYMKAKIAARNLADELGGKEMGWRGRVWENLGWHWVVEHRDGLIVQYDDLLKRYYVVSSNLAVSTTGKTPETALRKHWRSVQKELTRRHKLLATIERCLDVW